MGRIIDRFGEGVFTTVTDEEHFKVSVTIGLSNNFYGWVFASGGKMRILGPQKAVRDFNRLPGTFAAFK